MRRPWPDLLRSALACVAFAVSVAALPAAHAATSNDPSETCLACHQDKDAKGSSGKSIAVDPARYVKSVHGEAKLACTACHTDVSEKKIPHADKLKPVDCGSCHEKPVAQYRKTVHGVARKSGSEAAATCVDCHGKHDILRTKEEASRTSKSNLEATCGACHGKESLAGKEKMPGGNVAGKFHDSIHAKALAGAAHASAPTCTNCHGAHDIRSKDDAASATSRAKVPDTCGACHKKERAQYASGRHGKLRQEGNLGSPGCSDCHSAHATQESTAPGFARKVIEDCGTCHSAYLATYRDTFHGQVTALGYTTVATCASCHGAHDVRPASDPDSKVSAKNRPATCQKCHAGATVSFAGWDPHANKHDRARNPLYYFAALFMEWLLIGVFTFFGAHSVLWLYRSLKDRAGAKPPPRAGEGH